MFAGEVLALCYCITALIGAVSGYAFLAAFGFKPV